MAKATVRVAPGLARWAHGDGDLDLEGGRDYEVPTEGEAGRAVAAGVAAGALQVVDGELQKTAVESDDDSLARLERADAARAPLYEERDRELVGGGDATAVLDQYDERMAEAAQAALEG